MTQPPKGIGVTLLIISIIMLVLSCVTLALRLSVRTWTKQMGSDDYLMIVGLILYAVTCSLVIACSFYGSGQLAADLLPETQMMGIKLFWIAEFFYAGCTVPIKASICVCLLRIADTRRRFVYTLWAVIGATISASIIFIVAIANLCHPITTLWGETTYGSCNNELNSSVSFYFSAVSIVTDWTLAILPGILLWNVQMKRRAKASVAMILSLAAFASCATIVRLRYLTLYNNTAEFMYSTGQIGLWSVIEEGIGITAGSMPALGPLLHSRVFGRSRSERSDQPIKPTASMWRRNMAANGRKRTAEDSIALNTYLGGGGGGGNGPVGGHLTTIHGDCDRDRDLRDMKHGGAGAVHEMMHHHHHHHTMTGGSEHTATTMGMASRRTSDDGDSQKHILKETRVTVTHETCPRAGEAEEYRKEQILGWTNQHS